jgi:hypothetical protein
MFGFKRHPKGRVGAPQTPPRRTPAASLKTYFIYRRADTADVAGRLYDRFSDKFGAENIFKDVDSIAPGEDFRKSVQQEISYSDVVLVLIGPAWLSERLSDPADFVRMEIECALELNKTIVPILVSGAPMPSRQQLPESISAITSYNAANLRRDPDFRIDADRLIAALESLNPARERQIDKVDTHHKQTVFVSHATANRKWVEREVVSLLERSGIEPWFSTHKIETSAQWEREILRGLTTCDWFALVVSRDSAKSEWVKDELHWAFANRPKRIVPIVMERCDLYEFHIRLPRIQFVDFSGTDADARHRLIELLKQETT